MNKKSSINSILYLMIVGMLTKIISMSSRIILSRDLGVEAVSIYSLVNPLFVFGITIASFSLPTTMATLVSKNPLKAKKFFFTSMSITLILNIIIISLIMVFDEQISTIFLHNKETLFSIKLLTIVIPLTSISSIIKGYFMGKKEIALTSTSSLIEECSRLISCIGLSGLFICMNNDKKAALFIIVMIIGEIIQTLFLVLTSGKKYIIKINKIKDSLSLQNYEYSEVIKISLPMTISRILTSFTYMLEPIIITNILIRQGLSSSEITLNYGIISSYVMPLLLFPGFFSLAISNYLLPHLSSDVAKNRFKHGYTIYKNSLIICLLIGGIISLMFLFFGDKIIYIVYHVNFGHREIKLLAIPFLIYYIETPINMAMHALGLTNKAFISSLIASIIRLVALVSLLHNFGVFALCIATLISCYIDVISNFISIRCFFKRNHI